MVDATQILGELLGGGNRGSGNLNSQSGAKALEDLLGVGKGSRGGGGVFGGGDQQTGGGGKALKELTQSRTGSGGLGGGASAGNNPFEPQPTPQVASGEHTEVYVRAMIQAGLSDGRLDEAEQQAILQKVGKVGKQEADWIRAEIAKGSDVNAFIHSVPRGIEEEVYAVALMAINLDNRTEAQFLDALARGLRVTNDQSNAIHDRLGVTRLYS